MYAIELRLLGNIPGLRTSRTLFSKGDDVFSRLWKPQGAKPRSQFQRPTGRAVGQAARRSGATVQEPLLELQPSGPGRESLAPLWAPAQAAEASKARTSLQAPLAKLAAAAAVALAAPALARA